MTELSTGNLTSTSCPNFPELQCITQNLEQDVLEGLQNEHN